VTLNATLNLIGFISSAAGAVIGIAGSLMMANAYHPFSFLGFLRTLPDIAWRFLFGGGARAREYLNRTQRLAQINPEDRTLSLGGLCLIFGGFVLQLLGTILSYIGSIFPGTP
jgi:hypothetical protein